MTYPPKLVAPGTAPNEEHVEADYVFEQSIDEWPHPFRGSAGRIRSRRGDRFTAIVLDPKEAMDPGYRQWLGKLPELVGEDKLVRVVPMPSVDLAQEGKVMKGVGLLKIDGQDPQSLEPAQSVREAIVAERDQLESLIATTCDVSEKMCEAKIKQAMLPEPRALYRHGKRVVYLPGTRGAHLWSKESGGHLLPERLLEETPRMLTKEEMGPVAARTLFTVIFGVAPSEQALAGVAPRSVRKAFAALTAENAAYTPTQVRVRLHRVLVEQAKQPPKLVRSGHQRAGVRGRAAKVATLAMLFALLVVGGLVAADAMGLELNGLGGNDRDAAEGDTTTGETAGPVGAELPRREHPYPVQHLVLQWVVKSRWAHEDRSKNLRFFEYALAEKIEQGEPHAAPPAAGPPATILPHGVESVDSSMLVTADDKTPVEVIEAIQAELERVLGEEATVTPPSGDRPYWLVENSHVFVGDLVRMENEESNGRRAWEIRVEEFNEVILRMESISIVGNWLVQREESDGEEEGSAELSFRFSGQRILEVSFTMPRDSGGVRTASWTSKTEGEELKAPLDPFDYQLDYTIYVELSDESAFEIRRLPLSPSTRAVDASDDDGHVLEELSEVLGVDASTYYRESDSVPDTYRLVRLHDVIIALIDRYRELEKKGRAGEIADMIAPASD